MVPIVEHLAGKEAQSGTSVNQVGFFKPCMFFSDIIRKIVSIVYLKYEIV